MTQTLFLDANVLTSTTVLRWLFDFRAELGGQGLRLVTSLKTLSETGATMSWRVPESTGAQRDERMKELRKQMDEALAQYPSDLPFSGRDADDYHVHAAATVSGAQTLLSFNRRSDFTRKPTQESYRVTSPDDYLHELGAAHPEELREILRGRTAEGATVEKLALQLKKARCPRLAKLLPTL